jgi:hypothetical protein
VLAVHALQHWAEFKQNDTAANNIERTPTIRLSESPNNPTGAAKTDPRRATTLVNNIVGAVPLNICGPCPIFVIVARDGRSNDAFFIVEASWGAAFVAVGVPEAAAAATTPWPFKSDLCGGG